MLIIVALVIAAFCCTLAAWFYPGNPWATRVHLGWAGVAIWLWVQVFLIAHNVH